MSQAEVLRMKPPLVPLATLIGRELRNEKVEKPFVKHGQAALAKKGEDYFLVKPDCQRIPGNPASSFSVFAVFYSFLFQNMKSCLVFKKLRTNTREIELYCGKEEIPC